MEALITPAVYHSAKQCRRINCLSQVKQGQYLCQKHGEERMNKIIRSFGNLEYTHDKSS